MRSMLTFALAAFAAIACSKPAPPPLVKSKFQTFAERINFQPPCSTSVSAQLAPSFPVPAIEDGKLVYRIFFYGWEGSRRKGFKFHHAQGDARFTPDGKALSCSERPGKPTVYTAEKDHVTADERDRLEAKLYALTEQVAALYASRRPLMADEKNTVLEFSQLFADRIDSHQASDYLGLNPDFWAWVQKNGGRAP